MIGRSRTRLHTYCTCFESSSTADELKSHVHRRIKITLAIIRLNKTGVDDDGSTWSHFVFMERLPSPSSRQCPNSATSILCGFSVQQLSCTTNPQQISSKRQHAQNAQRNIDLPFLCVSVCPSFIVSKRRHISSLYLRQLAGASFQFS